MHFTKEELANKPRIERLNIINSISGIKPANLIGTRSNQTGNNLAIFSSVVHLGSTPALMGFILRPRGEVPRNTYENIKEIGYYTINHIPENMAQNAHYTSAKFEAEVSEFDACKITPEYFADFPAPFVKDSPLKIGLRFLQEIPIPINQTSLIIGEVEHLILPDNAITQEGYIDLEMMKTIGIGGLNNYYSFNKIHTFPFARPKELPDF